MYYSLTPPRFSAKHYVPVSGAKNGKHLTPDQLTKVDNFVSLDFSNNGIDPQSQVINVFPHDGYVEAVSGRSKPKVRQFEFNNNTIDYIHPGGPLEPNGKVWKSDDLEY
ncbi:MAG: hypothetical protein QE263_05580 [Vampirovibrionales bacterium]|nr:hypothetical protein [Vampirovibrionales bacterium]